MRHRGAGKGRQEVPWYATRYQERGVLLERAPLADKVVIADKGFTGAEFEVWMADRGATFLRPDRKDEPPRFGSLGRIRQSIESWVTCPGR